VAPVHRGRLQPKWPHPPQPEVAQTLQQICGTVDLLAPRPPLVWPRAQPARNLFAIKTSRNPKAQEAKPFFPVVTKRHPNADEVALAFPSLREGTKKAHTWPRTTGLRHLFLKVWVIRAATGKLVSRSLFRVLRHGKEENRKTQTSHPVWARISQAIALNAFARP